MIDKKAVLLVSSCAVLLFSGCASTGNFRPGTWRNLDANFQDVFFDPQGHIGDDVIWAGEIVNIASIPGGTELTIRQVPLAPRGMPWKTQYSHGRFVIRCDEILDPAVYQIRSLLVVKGIVSGALTKPYGKDGDQSYTYPVVRGAEFHFWKRHGDEGLMHCWQTMGWQGPYRWKCEGEYF